MSETNGTDATGVEMDETPSIAELSAALAKAQAVMGGAKKDGFNPHYKSKYADLASAWDAAREALTSNGLAVMQRVSSTATGVLITTQLTHSSGQWVKDRCEWPVAQKTPQGMGSAITYGRRYAFMALVGIAAEEDDGNAASEQPHRQATPVMASAPVQQASLVGKIRFGKKKGVPLADLDAPSLKWYAEKVAGSSRPDDVAMSSDIQEEMSRRGVSQ